MIAKKKPPPHKPMQHQELFDKIKHYSNTKNAREAMEKDSHLQEAALSTDKIIFPSMKQAEIIFPPFPNISDSYET